MTEHVFMSYARSDGAEVTETIYQDLIKLSVNVWLDKYSIDPGKDWDQEIDNGLRNAIALLVILTPGSVLSVQVKSEWNYALNKHIPVIPLLTVTCDVPRTLSVFNWIDFRSDYKGALQSLHRQLLKLPNNHYQHLVNALNAYKSAQDDSDHPERFMTRIESLQAVIANWDKFQIEQDVRIATELQEVRTQLYKKQLLSKSIKTVGRKPYDIFVTFKDRTIVREKIRDMLFDLTTKLISLVGRGGMGKTATVCKVLNDIENHRGSILSGGVAVDGIVYLGTRTEEITLEKLLGNMVSLFSDVSRDNVRQVISDPNFSDEEKITQLFKHVGNQKFIIFLDNLEDMQDEEGRILNGQIELFIKIFLTTDFDSKLLITSRTPLLLDRRLMQYDRRILLVDGIPKEEAIELLCELDPHGHFGLKGASADDLASILELTHAVPRSLEITVSMFANDPFLSIDEFTSQTFHEEVNALSLVQEMYHRLDKNSLTLIEVLAVFGRPVDSVGIDYVLDKYAPNIDVRSKLRFLTTTHTVTVNRAEKTVALHPIDRDFIYGNLLEVKPDQLCTIEQLAADYYSEISTSSDLWQTIDDLQNSIYEFGHCINAKACERAHQILIRLDNDHLFKWGYYKRLLSMYEELKSYFAPSEELAQILDRLALLMFRLGDSQQSIAYANRALQMVPQGVLRNNLLNTLGSSYIYLGQFEDALLCYEQGITNARVRNDRNQESHFLAQIGFAYYNLANNKNMLEAYNESMNIAKETNDLELQQILLGYLSKGYSQLGQFEEMLVYAKQALEITRIIGDSYEECMRLSDLGDGSLRLGRFTDAIEYLNDAMIIAEELDAVSAIGYRAWLLGWSYIGNQQYQKAKVFLIRALHIGKELGNPHLIQRSAYHLCHVYILDNQFDDVKNVLADIPIRDGVLRTKYHLTLLEGLLAQRDGNLLKAEDNYRYTLECIEEIITESPDFLEVWYDKPIALAGIALVDPDNAKSHVDEGIKALEHGLGLAFAKGVLVDSELMLRLLTELDSENHLSKLVVRVGEVLKV